MNKKKDFCFCTLALGNKHRILANRLAEDIEKYSLETLFIVLTDRPKDFVKNHNVLTFKHKQKSILRPFNDKRFVIEKALSLFRTAIFLDADARIVNKIPCIKWQPGITSSKIELINSHNTNLKLRYIIKKIAYKLGLSLNKISFIFEDLFIITKDEGKENQFIKYWEILARYFELKGFHSSEGNSIGLAASKVGWIIKKNDYKLRKNIRHRHGLPKRKNILHKFKLALGFTYRFSKEYLISLTNFDFYHK